MHEPGVAPLQTLAAFGERHLANVVSSVHLLPFYPWSSDDGFSVKDYFAVEPAYGNWADLAATELEKDLASGQSLRTAVFKRYETLQKARRNQAAFNPHAEQRVLPVDPRLFVVLRATASGGEWVLGLHNVSGELVTLEISGLENCTELLSPETPATPKHKSPSLTLAPYAVNWLAGNGPRPETLTVVG